MNRSRHTRKQTDAMMGEYQCGYRTHRESSQGIGPSWQSSEGWCTDSTLVLQREANTEACRIESVICSIRG